MRYATYYLFLGTKYIYFFKIRTHRKKKNIEKNI